MPKPLATIPPDLRGRRDLTIPQLETIVALRTARKRWQTTLDGLPDRAVQIQKDIDDNLAEEEAILDAAEARATQDV